MQLCFKDTNRPLFEGIAPHPTNPRMTLITIKQKHQITSGSGISLLPVIMAAQFGDGSHTWFTPEAREKGAALLQEQESEALSSSLALQQHLLTQTMDADEQQDLEDLLLSRESILSSSNDSDNVIQNIHIIEELRLNALGQLDAGPTLSVTHTALPDAEGELVGGELSVTHTNLPDPSVQGDLSATRSTLPDPDDQSMALSRTHTNLPSVQGDDSTIATEGVEGMEEDDATGDLPMHDNQEAEPTPVDLTGEKDESDSDEDSDSDADTPPDPEGDTSPESTEAQPQEEKLQWDTDLVGYSEPSEEWGFTLTRIEGNPLEGLEEDDPLVARLSQLRDVTGHWPAYQKPLTFASDDRKTSIQEQLLKLVQRTQEMSIFEYDPQWKCLVPDCKCSFVQPSYLETTCSAGQQGCPNLIHPYCSATADWYSPSDHSFLYCSSKCHQADTATRAPLVAKPNKHLASVSAQKDSDEYWLEYSFLITRQRLHKELENYMASPSEIVNTGLVRDVLAVWIQFLTGQCKRPPYGLGMYLSHLTWSELTLLIQPVILPEDPNNESSQGSSGEDP